MIKKFLMVAALLVAQFSFASDDIIEECASPNGSVKLTITTGQLMKAQEDAPSIPVDGKKEVYTLNYNGNQAAYGIVDTKTEFESYDMDFDHYAEKIVRPNEINIFLAETDALLLKIRFLPMLPLSETEKVTYTRVFVLNGGQIYEGHNLNNNYKKVSVDVPAAVLYCKMKELGPEN